jgi:hypothetical protein
MSRRLIATVVTLLCAFLGGNAVAQEAIGAVSRIQGEASETRGGATRALVLKAPVFLNEIVSTGEGARLEVTFADDTRVTVGEKAKLTLDTFVFDPAAGNGTIKFGATGALRFVSGKLTKLASADVSVTTGVATLGIRGTEFWGGPIDDQALGMFLVSGVVSVSNAAGEQILSRPGHQYCNAGLGARARDLLAPGQGRPRHRDGDVPAVSGLIVRGQYHGTQR